MKTHPIALGLLLLAAALPAAQAQPTANTIWAVHRAVKVNPGKTAAFTEFYATTVKRFHQARKDGGAQIGCWRSSLFRRARKPLSTT